MATHAKAARLLAIAMASLESSSVAICDLGNVNVAGYQLAVEPTRFTTIIGCSQIEGGLLED
jgi:hypothetical protein